MKSQRSTPMNSREIIYRDYEGGRLVYFMYAEGQRHFVARSWAEDQVCRGYARYVDAAND